jgi:hypothetical protein
MLAVSKLVRFPVTFPKNDEQAVHVEPILGRQSDV